MSEPADTSFLDDLVADLRPIKRLHAPWLGALSWLAVVAVIAGLLAAQADLRAVLHRLSATSDMWLAFAGSSATAVLAAIATFQLILPDRRGAWALLPLPGLAIWMAASGAGCARTWLIQGTRTASLAEARHCFTFILSASIPLSVLLLVMLRRGYTMYPALTGGTAGLATAAAAATLLTFFHPFDASFGDLAIHAAVVALVVGLNTWAGDRLLCRRLKQPTGR